MKHPTTVCVIDAGGRGTVLVEKYAQSPVVDELIAIPGNDWMPLMTKKNVTTFPNLKTTSITEIVEICKRKKVQLVDVAQDNAVEAGLVDALTNAGVTAIGPTKVAGEIEWNKAFARKLLAKVHVNQPQFCVFTNRAEAKAYLEQSPEQAWFIKAAGLCEGKGVLPAKTNQAAIKRLLEMKRFGSAGSTFLVERWLTSDDGSLGEEFSAFALCAGKTFELVGFAQDHKRIYNFDEGENTGGIGTTSPPLVINKSITKQVNEIFYKTLTVLATMQRPYFGILYLGGMLVKHKGKLVPYVIEYNARWGDPEAQVLVPAIKNDLFITGITVSANKVVPHVQIDHATRVCVTGCARGYPKDYNSVKGKQIFGIDKARRLDGVSVYGSGIKVVNGKHYVNGGRVFHLVGRGKNVFEARERAYHAMSLISIEGNNLHYRTDIAWRDVERVWR